MAWLDDRLWCHPKFAGLSDHAFRVYVNALAYSSGFQLAGRLTRAQQDLCGVNDVTRDVLIMSRLWDADTTADDGSIVIHDWAEHNGKRDARRAADRLRKRRQRDRERDSPRDTGVTPPVTSGVTGRGKGAGPAHVDRVTNDIPPVGQTLVAYYVDQARERGATNVPRRIVGQAAKLIGELVADGTPPEQIQAGIRKVLDKGLNVATLPSCVLEASLAPRAVAKGSGGYDDPSVPLGGWPRLPRLDEHGIEIET